MIDLTVPPPPAHGYIAEPYSAFSFQIDLSSHFHMGKVLEMSEQECIVKAQLVVII